MHRPRPRYVIDRPVFNLPDFDQEFDKKSRQFPIGLGFMQFGFVAIYLSESFIRGFMTAAGLQILISTLVDIFRGLPETNVASLVFALVGSVVLIVQFVASPTVCQLACCRKVDLRLPDSVESPGTVAGAVAAVSPSEGHVGVTPGVQSASAQAKPFTMPQFDPLSAQSSPTGSKLDARIKVRVARLRGRRRSVIEIFRSGGSWRSGSPNTKRLCFSCLDPGHLVAECVAWKQQVAASKHSIEMLALGCSNFLGSFFKIHVICCALSVTLAVDSAGGTSQFASLCVMLVVMVTMLSLGAFLKPLPKPAVRSGCRDRTGSWKTDPGQEEIISQLEMQDDFDTSSPRISYVNFHSGSPPPHPGAGSPTLELKPTPFHTLILDLPGVCFMDLTGINTLIKMNSSYTTLGIKLYLANVQAQVYEELEAGGAFDDGNISRSNLFLSVHDAVVFAQQSSAERRVSWEAEKAKQELSSNINEEKDLEQEMFEH
ncbi:hypothetical protein F7725_001320 [Dissostichus mawsoni]|uniref:STAS domain-containing protein n=1 Tax=Dissostichus mawsoni TaxID=36200 RepID=A0A7J5ZGZ8_DISMA|nr:hypothetical protein F7725_001320 [Dissostichus mawsoni]